MEMRITKIPLVGGLAKRLYPFIARARYGRADLRIIDRLESIQENTSTAIAHALRLPPADQDDAERYWVSKIEERRSYLCARDEPLADETIGPPGPFDAGITVAAACRASKPPRESLFLYRLVKGLQPRVAVELGTNLGISAAYQASAMLDLGAGGRLITIEASSYRLRLARQVHHGLGLSNIEHVEGTFDDTLHETLAIHSPVDLAFIDGHHKYTPTISYCNEILNRSSDSATLVLDDIRWSAEMTRAWNELKTYDVFGLVIDLGTMGILVCNRERNGRHIVGPIRTAFL